MTTQGQAGVWPVMLTPFTDEGKVDYPALEALVEWYEAGGADGLFAVCQSSEMFYLSVRERVEITAFVCKKAKIPVIASGHVSEALEDQAEELERIAQTGAQAVILLTNRFAREGDAPAVWRANLERFLSAFRADIPLGFYECPYPYKRLLSGEELSYLVSLGRFRFLKDTCCDLSLIRQRTKLLEGSGLGLYNANSATLLESLRCGAAGFSGVMANFHPELYAWLTKNWQTQPEKAETLQSFLTLASFIERQCYPVNAKYHLSTAAGLPMGIYTRARSHREMTPLFRHEVQQLAAMTRWIKDMLEI